ncbi:hypothetical protein GCM10023187_09380 [Nibrella viscosa]|uniref:Response regulatory domain-containing protein n=2 Tax=Nibrella viscosa TaxID=1084524 RepID=A0ABP8JZW4_9BACT
MLSECRWIFFGEQVAKDVDGEDKDDKQLDWLCNRICEVLEHDAIPFLIIQQNLLPGYPNSGIRLIAHIRLHENNRLNQLPIIVLTDRVIDKLMPKTQQEWEPLAPLFSKGVRFTPEQDREKRYLKNDSLLFQEVEKLYSDLIKDGKNEVDLFQFTSFESPEIPIQKPEGTNHQVTNDWGAYRLIQAAGIQPAHEYRKHLYFTYLQRSSKTPAPVSEELYKEKINSNLKILLIDDNFDKGWKDSIERILKKCLLKGDCIVKIDAFEYADDVVNLLYEKDGKLPIDEYDLIYLDLRLPKNQANQSNPIVENGKEVLINIKEANPIIPIIMFTASTKATNMDELYELGVDGYFVKEFPESRNDPNFSKFNLENFIRTTKNCINKGFLLKKYWYRIKRLRQSNIINEHSYRDRTITYSTKFSDRIPERLEMFVGILKKAFEQTDFDHSKFYYDQYETAYLTLWSCLNDITASCYSRTTRYARRQYRWEERFTNYVYVDFYNNIEVSPLRYDSNTPPYFTLALSDSQSRDFLPTPSWISFQTSLFSQVAFLIISLCQKNSISDLERDKYLCLIKEANDVRNKLWLTHSDLFEPNYLSGFSRTLQSDRKIGGKNEEFWQERIADLFEVVEFLIAPK